MSEPLTYRRRIQQQIKFKTYMPTPTNKTTLITGVSSGIGREIATLLAERGARVFGTVRDPKSAKPIPGVEIVRMEVTDDSSVNEAVRSIVQKAGPIQHLVNNAGYAATGALEETSVEKKPDSCLKPISLECCA